MKLFGYYALHTCINGLKKLLKTWVAFILIFGLLGGVIGVGVGLLLPDDEESDIVEDNPGYSDNWEDDFFIDLDDDGINDVDLSLFKDGMAILEIVAFVIILFFVIISFLNVENAAGSLFKPADIPILFTSPMTPQGVLLFRLVTGMGMMVLISLYMLFQLPNLVLNMGLAILHALAILVAWMVLLVFNQVCSAFLYVLVSTHRNLKRWVTPFAWGIVGLFLVTFTIYYQTSGENVIAAVLKFFTNPASRWVPVIGWTRGIFMFLIDGEVLSVVLCLLLMVAFIVVLVLVTWHIPADYYEDATEKTAEIAALTEKAKESASGVAVKRKKRIENQAGEGFPYGFGANVYFFKAMFLRARVAYFHLLTKTNITCLVVGGLTLWVVKGLLESTSFMPVALTLAAIMFFRALGSNLGADTHMDYFLTIPAPAALKLFYALLGDAANCFLDILPAMVVGGIVMQAGVLEILGWSLFTVTLYLYSICVSNFIDLSVQVQGAGMIKQLIQVLFIYFGLLPDIILLVVGGLLGVMPLMTLIAALVNLGFAGLFFGITPYFLERR